MLAKKKFRVVGHLAAVYGYNLSAISLRMNNKELKSECALNCLIKVFALSFDLFVLTKSMMKIRRKVLDWLVNG